VQDYAHVPILRHLRRSSGLASALSNTTPTVDVVHSHGLWLMPNIEAGRAAMHEGKPLVVSPRGMLSPAALSFSRLKKRVFWTLFQGPATRTAACLHATSTQEYEEIRSFGLKNPVAVISNGIDLPTLGKPACEPRITRAVTRVVLSLGRIHPKKGLDRLLHAWSMIEARYPCWRLRLIGPDEAGHADQLRALADSLGLIHAVIEGPVFGGEKWDVYRNADVFVLASQNENFGLTVAEALAAGTPVISTKGAPWSGLEHEQCGWWIDQGIQHLAAALERAMALPRSELLRMGEKGRAWMSREFSWERAAQDMLAVYRWLAYDREPPRTVRFD
jgi:glycosyltransferase involved in cell wall biosynthesis